MTPKEKAIELYNKFEKIIIDANADYWSKEAKKCALIAVEELIGYTESVDGRPPNCQDIDEYCSEYWIEVKQELEKLV